MAKKKVKKPLTIQQKINRRTFISFGVFGAAAVGGVLSWRWLYHAPEEATAITGGQRVPLRRALNKTEIAVRRLLYNENHLVKTYPKHMAAKNVRVNSDIGIEAEKKFDVADWMLEVKKQNGDTLKVSLDELKMLPKTEIVYDFKCVEGWDQISHWGGVKFSDFLRHYKLDDQTLFQYVGMETPDKSYYVGVDMPSAIHPQTIMAYEVNSMPLPLENGAPLRLIIPVKYGIKNLKRIGTITFSNTRPRDYWAELGYDYYSGL
ncbi:molybdopterin-dependent oxidoreductase [Mucilaginibacter panaciglaebae]|uniref:Molybdopterin-binding protein n=1 Tax=Mucilaginibacter panaciglaebae TaxID=502331 RepID=A0ABP7WYE8_9SPHI